MKDVNELFRDRDIYIEECNGDYIGETTKEDYMEQIRYIIEFQNRLMGYRENIIPRLSSSIGKEVENFKVSLKKLKRGINNLEDNRDSSINLYIKENKEKLISRSEKAIELVTSDEYYKIIKRSMARYEVCLGKCDRSNLIVSENKIKIASMKYMSYNLIENDIYSYLRKLKKRRIKLDYLDLINLFIDKSNLDKASLKYIIGLLSFPSEEVKLLQRFSGGRLDISSEELIIILEREKRINAEIVGSFEGVIE
ncbi:MAG: hypothetical protein RR620_10660 [Clostridium sp.]